MRKLLIITALITLIFTSCDSSKKLAQSRQSAATAYNSGDYAKALSMYEALIAPYEANDNKKECPEYTNAGKAAFMLKNYEKAEKYLKSAYWSNFANDETYLYLAKLYAEKDNLSLELENLEFYSDKYPEGKEINAVNKRLFELYTEIESWDKALQFYNKLSEEEKQSEVKSALKVYDGLNMDAESLSAAKAILKSDANDLEATKWMANHYFWKAEKRYQKEMKAYDKNKTRKQYAHLLKVIDEVSVEYKIALKHAKKLYKLEATAENAKLLGNTYSRLNYKDKAKYYQNLGKK